MVAPVMLILATSIVKAPPATYLIVPAHRIGHISLGPNGAAALSHLPHPDANDEGMMQTENVWYSKSQGHRYSLFIHTTSNSALAVDPTSGVTIDTIRVTSPTFRTSSGIGPGSTFAQIEHAFPKAKPIDKSHTIYDAVWQGIAFEFPNAASASTHCIAVTVHTPGEINIPSTQQVATLDKNPDK